MRATPFIAELAAVFCAGIIVVASSPVVQTEQVTFTKDIAPILQRSCQSCHRPGSVAPMSLLTYEDARPFARAMKQRTALRHRRGAMPPWFIEKEIGIQGFKDDLSLSDDEIAKIAKWADDGAPRGNPADMPPALVFADNASWQIGTPDLIVRSPTVNMKAVSPDYWGALAGVPTGLTEDRYVAALEIKEVNDSRDKPGRSTVGALFVFHHAVLTVSADGRGGGGAWPVHEVGRNADIFDSEAGKLLRAGSMVAFPSVHLHSNGKDTSASLQVGFKFHPVGYKPKVQSTLISIGTDDIDIPGGASGVTQSAYMTLTQPLKLTVFEPHMHATGVRMCLEAIYGSQVETLNCSGYDHSWVKTYAYREDTAPLLPRGTILKVTGYFDNTPGNKNVVDPRNWSGLGHRSIDNMLVMIAQGVNLTDQQLAEEVAKRRAALNLAEGKSSLGCPQCTFAKIPGLPAPPAGARP